MKKPVFLIILLLGAVTLMSQDILLTFTGTGESTVIDSIMATNFSTNESITLPGNETLVLTLNTGVPPIKELTRRGWVFPNPFSGNATFIVSIQKPQTVYLKVQNLVGQIVAQTIAFASPGENEFSLSVATAGIYFVSLRYDEGTVGHKVICTGVTELENRIQYKGTITNYDPNPSPLARKSVQTAYTLGYTTGDVIHFKCISGVQISIITDSPVASKNYEVTFVACTDLDGKNYSNIKIGDQTWMAENMAYLPSVNNSSEGSSTSPYYYVYGYEGDHIDGAKATDNYSTFGVLYNWLAAMTSCPSGWHLPTDDEWTILSNYLIEHDYGYDGSGSDIAKSLASNSGWYITLETGTVGNDQATNNTSGFNALPGGLWYDYAGFIGITFNAAFWSASLSDDSDAWIRHLSSGSDFLGRNHYIQRRGYYVRCIKDVVWSEAR